MDVQFGGCCGVQAPSQQVTAQAAQFQAAQAVKPAQHTEQPKLQQQLAQDTVTFSGSCCG